MTSPTWKGNRFHMDPQTSRAPAQRRQAPTQGIEQIREQQQQGLAVAGTVGRSLRENYREWFEPLLPAHMPVDAFLTLLYGALRKDTDLARAAQINFQSLLIAATDCAQLGGIPGKNYHFLTFTDQDTGWPTITGVTDYKLEIQLALNATDQIDTVEVEVVYQADHFFWKPGMEIPDHEFKDEIRENENLKAVYAYCTYRGRRVGKLILMYRAEVMLHRAKARSKKLWDGPWAPDMWRKTGIHKGRRFWPQSPARIRQLVTAQAAALDMGGTMMQLEPGDSPVLVPPKRGQLTGKGDGVPDGDMISVTPDGQDGNGHPAAEDKDDGGWPDGARPAGTVNLPRTGGGGGSPEYPGPPGATGSPGHSSPGTGGGLPGPSGTTDGDPSGERVSRETAGDGTVPPAAADEKLARDQVRQRQEWVNKLATRFASFGDAWRGPDSVPARLVVAGVLAASKETGEPPMQLTNIGELDDARLARVYRRLQVIKDGARKEQRDPGGDLQKLHDAAVQAREQQIRVHQGDGGGVVAEAMGADDDSPA